MVPLIYTNIYTHPSSKYENISYFVLILSKPQLPLNPLSLLYLSIVHNRSLNVISL